MLLFAIQAMLLPALLIALLWASARHAPLRTHFGYALALKIMAGFAIGALYFFFYGSGDTTAYFHDAVQIRQYALENPRAFFSFLFDFSHQVPPDLPLIFQTERAVFMDKLAGLVCLASGNNYWLIAFYFSLFSFLGLWKLANSMALLLPKAHWPAAIAFLYWPSVAIWSAGLLKESVLMGCMGLLVADAIRWLYLGRKYTLATAIKAAVCLWLIFEMKYYYFAAIALALGALIISEKILKRFIKPAWAQISCLVLVGISLLFLAQYAHPNLRMGYVAEALAKNHRIMAAETANQANLIVLPQLDGSASGLLCSMPRAFFEGMLRPYLWEDGHWLKRLMAVETALAFVLFLLAIPAFFRMKVAQAAQLPLMVALGYILLLGILLPVASPNLGNLVRYKTGYWCFHIFLILYALGTDKSLGSKAVWSLFFRRKAESTS